MTLGRVVRRYLSAFTLLTVLELFGWAIVVIAVLAFTIGFGFACPLSCTGSNQQL